MRTEEHNIKQGRDLSWSIGPENLEKMDKDRKEVVTISVTTLRSCTMFRAPTIILDLLAAENPGFTPVLAMRELPEFSEPRLNKTHDAEDRRHDVTKRRVLSNAL